MSQNLFKPRLLRWKLRQLFPVNACMLIATVFYTLSHRNPLIAPGEFWMLLVIVAHSSLVVWMSGRGTSRHCGFLHAQGYTRDQMWFQIMLASACSALVVCGSMWLMMVLGLRAYVQDHVFQSPWFPFMRPGEYSLPGVLLLEYAVTMLLMHYAWIRGNQSARDAVSGWILMCLGICFLMWGFELSLSHRWHPSFLNYVPLLLGPVIVLLLIAGVRAHRTMEVRT